MENLETVKFYEECLTNLASVYRVKPVAIAHDLHPGYMSTQWALQCGVRSAECGINEKNLKLVPVQHHYAHIGSVMAEHGLKDKVIGVACDGTGYGTDGNLWGGEFLIADVDGFERAAQFSYLPLPGGESAIREPWRTAISCLVRAAGDRAMDMLEKAGFSEKYGKSAVEQVMQVSRIPEVSPLSSGAGRLFDAVSALIGACDRNTFEGEAAMALEALTIDDIDDQYVVEFIGKTGYTELNFNATMHGILRDFSQGLGKQVIATKFHNTIATSIGRIVRKIHGATGIGDVALSGGTFQNLYLLNRTVRLLAGDGMQVYVNRRVPCNDGGISLGQAYLVRERLKKCGEQSVEFGK